MAGKESNEFMEIDGSILEGGGQILRNTIALAALLGHPVRISRIRAGRDKPGLKAQHCAGIQLVAKICSAIKCDGCVRDSVLVTFQPPLSGGIPGGDFTEDIGTAGSVCLLIQAALPVLAFANAPSRLRIRGGTNVDFAPPAEHFSETLAPLVGSTLGLQFSISVARRGFYPKGGGDITLEVQPLNADGLRPVRLLEQGRVDRISGVAYACGALPIRIAEEMASVARQRLAAAYPNAGVEIRVDSNTRAIGNGCGIALTAHTSTGCVLGASSLGRRGVPAAEVAAEAVDRLMADLSRGACVDEHTQCPLRSSRERESQLPCFSVGLNSMEYW